MCKTNHFRLFCKACLVPFLTFGAPILCYTTKDLGIFV